MIRYLRQRYKENKSLICTCIDTQWKHRHCLFFRLCLDALACGRPCAYKRVFSMCEGECMYLQLSPLICMRYSYLAQCTALEQEWVHSSPRVCVCMWVCGYTDPQTECRPKHKNGFCLSSLQTCQWLQHSSIVPPRTWHSHWDRWTGTYALEGFVIIQKKKIFHPWVRVCKLFSYVKENLLLKVSDWVK